MSHHLTVFALTTSSLWTALAVYGCTVQTINLRWALYKRRLMRRRVVRDNDEMIAVRGHIRINLIRTLAVTINLVVGLLAIFRPQPQALTINGVIYAAGFLVNEVGWNTVITIEIVARQRLRGRSG